MRNDRVLNLLLTSKNRRRNLVNVAVLRISELSTQNFWFLK
jgi:hypothetical protein